MSGTRTHLLVSWASVGIYPSKRSWPIGVATGTEKTTSTPFSRTTSRTTSTERRRARRRGALAPALSTTLDAQQVTTDLRSAFGDHALALAATATIDVVVQGQSWSVLDATNEVTYSVESEHDQLAVYDGGLAYELTSYQPWRIRYYSRFERWEITREDGITTVFGGGLATNADGSKASLGSSIQWGVRCGNWIGPSTVTHDPANPSRRIQEQFPLAWNRSKSYDPWGGEVYYVYQVVEQAVGAGGLSYTKASYISQVVDEFGRKVSFTYADKIYDATSPNGWREYQDPYKPTPSADPDAYQSRYETKYLQQIDVSSPTGQLLYSLLFASSPVSYATLPSNYPPDVFGDTGKRTLNSIEKKVPSVPSLPPIRFTYYQGADLNPGALHTITHPKGSTITFSYQQKELATCARAFVVDNPLVSGGTPRVFLPDYAVVTRYDGQGRLSIGAYTWLGRWQTWHPPEPIVNDFVDLSQLHALVEDDFFVLYYATQDGSTVRAWSFHKDDNYLGAWLASADDPITISTTRVQTASGTNYFAIANLDSGELLRFRWDTLNKTWVKDQLAQTGVCRVGRCQPVGPFPYGDRELSGDILLRPRRGARLEEQPSAALVPRRDGAVGAGRPGHRCRPYDLRRPCSKQPVVEPIAIVRSRHVHDQRPREHPRVRGGHLGLGGGRRHGLQVSATDHFLLFGKQEPAEQRDHDPLYRRGRVPRARRQRAAPVAVQRRPVARERQPPGPTARRRLYCLRVRIWARRGHHDRERTGPES